MEEAVNFADEHWSIADEHWSIAECLPCTEKPCGPQAILMARMQIRPPLPVVLQSSGRSSGALAASKPALSKPLAASSSAAKPSTSRSRTAKRKADAAEADEGSRIVGQILSPSSNYHPILSSHCSCHVQGMFE